MHPEPFIALLHNHLIVAGKITFCKAQVMYGIQEVRFSLSVIAANANNALVKRKLLLKVILELK